jgi:hypothetical protein
LTFLAEKRRILGKKTVRFALRGRERYKDFNGKRYGTVRYGIEDKFGSPTVKAVNNILVENLFLTLISKNNSAKNNFFPDSKIKVLTHFRHFFETFFF